MLDDSPTRCSGCAHPEPPTLVLITSCLHLHTLSKITILKFQIGLYHSIFKVLPAARSLSHARLSVPGVTSHWSVLGTLPLNGSFSLICLVKRGSCSGLGHSALSSSCAAALVSLLLLWLAGSQTAGVFHHQHHLLP